MQLESKRRREEEELRASSQGQSLSKDKTTEAAIAVTHSVGDFVECRYMQGNKWLRAKVTAVSETGKYSLEYDQGESEFDVDSSFIRALQVNNASSPTSIPGKFKPGQPVDARFLGEEKWYPAVIVVYHGDGTYDVNFEQSGLEKGVPESFIRIPQDQAIVHEEARPPSSNALLTTLEQFFYDINGDCDGHLSHADLDDLMNDVTNESCKELIKLLKLPKDITGPEMRSLFDNMGSGESLSVTMEEFVAYVSSSSFVSNVNETSLRYEVSTTSPVADKKSSPRMPSGAPPVSPRVLQSESGSAVHLRASNQDSSPEHDHILVSQDSALSAFSESEDEASSNNVSDDGAFSGNIFTITLFQSTIKNMSCTYLRHR